MIVAGKIRKFFIIERKTVMRAKKNIFRVNLSIFGVIFVLSALNINAGEKVAFASYTDAAPVIDGDISDACWSKAEAVTDFLLVADTATPAPLLTTFKILYDAGNLYIAVDCWMGDTSGVKSPEPEPGKKDQYTSLYSIEVFLDPLATRSVYYQLAWGVGGCRYDGYRMDGKVFDGGWKFKTKVLRDRWTSEVVIPLAELQNALPVTPGAEWGFNIMRNDLNNYSLWKSTGGAFHTPSMFGTLVMGDYGTWWKKAYAQDAAAAVAALPKNIARYPENNYLNGQMRKITALDGKISARGCPAADINREEMLELYAQVKSLKYLLNETEKYLAWHENVFSSKKQGRK